VQGAAAAAAAVMACASRQYVGARHGYDSCRKKVRGQIAGFSCMQCLLCSPRPSISFTLSSHVHFLCVSPGCLILTTPNVLNPCIWALLRPSSLPVHTTCAKHNCVPKLSHTTIHPRLQPHSQPKHCVPSKSTDAKICPLSSFMLRAPPSPVFGKWILGQS
jgi:hypothetical protein